MCWPLAVVLCLMLKPRILLRWNRFPSEYHFSTVRGMKVLARRRTGSKLFAALKTGSFELTSHVISSQVLFILFLFVRGIRVDAATEESIHEHLGYSQVSTHRLHTSRDRNNRSVALHFHISHNISIEPNEVSISTRSRAAHKFSRGCIYGYEEGV